MHHRWEPIKIDGRYDYDTQALEENWNRLHSCQSEPFPSADFLRAQVENNPRVKQSMPDFNGDYQQLSEQVLSAWRKFHRGDFKEAFADGRKLGYPGYLVAHMASCVYAENSGADKEMQKQIFWDSAQQSLDAAKAMPDHINSMFFYGLHLGRYSESISLLKAASENIAPKFVQALTEALAKAPNHLLAHVGMGAFHASVVGTAGALVAKLTFGASKEKAYHHFEAAMKYAPHLPVTYIEYGRGLLLLEGKKGQAKAQSFFEKAATLPVMDAMEELDVKQCAR